MLIYFYFFIVGLSNTAGSAPSSPGTARRMDRLTDQQQQTKGGQVKQEEEEGEHDEKTQPQSLDHQLFGTREQNSGGCQSEPKQCAVSLLGNNCVNK